MNRRFGETTSLCNRLSCKIKKHCIHFLALLEHRDGDYLNECDKVLLDLPIPQYNTDCLFCSKEGYCYKRHCMTCQMECNNCTDFIKRTYDKQNN